MQNLNFKIYFKPSLWLTIFTIPSIIILLVLGTWQVQRLGWKSDLISEYNNNFEKQPVTIDEVLKDSLNYKFMGSIDGEIPAVWFLISSIGFIILSFIQYRNTGKSINTIFLSIMAILFLFSYFILLFKT